MQRDQLLERQDLKFINVNTIRFFANSFKNNKATGLDRLKQIAIKKLPDSAMEIISLLFKASVALGHVPKEWRYSKVILIPKRGKNCSV